MNNVKLQTSIQLMNAAVIGLLAATWLDSIIVTTISSYKDVVFIAILAIAYLKLKVTPTSYFKLTYWDYFLLIAKKNTIFLQTGKIVFLYKHINLNFLDHSKLQKFF